MNKKIKTLKPANIDNLNKYPKKYLPNIKPIDNRKYPFKNFNKQYKLKLKTEQLEQINKIIELENIKTIKQHNKEKKILNKLIKDVNKRIKERQEEERQQQQQQQQQQQRQEQNLNIINDYINSLRSDLTLMQDGKNNHILELGEIANIEIDEDYKDTFIICYSLSFQIITILKMKTQNGF